MTDTAPKVHNIPAGLCFADALAQGVIDCARRGPFALGDYMLLLPSRRACRILRDAFLRLSGGVATLLPRMHPIGDVDAEEVTLLLAGEEGMPDIPPAASRLERQVLLARTIMKVPGMAASFDQAAALALELGGFLDEVQTEGLDFSGLGTLVPEAFAEHWQKTLTFLRILTEHWPKVLEERGVIDQAARRNLLLRARAQAWARHPPDHPVIAAGSTGTVPAAADLVCRVARFPHGEVVLPGLDTALDDESWDALGEDHPQYGLKTLLGRLGVARAQVTPWQAGAPPAAAAARARLLSEAMRPARTSEKWRALAPRDIPGRALDGLTRIDCATPQEEADMIALLMREALETPGRTAALITPDRRLARRVSLSLRRWGIEIDDTGGQPLTELPAGTWLMLTAEMARDALAPVALLSCLKHPLMAAHMDPHELRGMTYMLDELVLRGPRPSAGFAGLYDAIDALPEKQEGSRKALRAWIGKIEVRAAAFTGMMAGREERPFRDLLSAHLRMAESLAATQDQAGAGRLWRGDAGEAASEMLASLLAAAQDVPALSPEHYVSLLGALMKQATVRPRYGTHPRLSILGQMEARLYCADVVVLGGLNEGTWPALPDHDPWMSRPMRRDFGLPSPERKLGLAAHDFVQAAAAPEVFLTRARKVDGAPTVPARWLMRIETVLRAVGLEWDEARAMRYRQWLQRLDTPPAPPRPAPRPAPCPPLAARPRSLSVTQVEAWMRDPYQIYARKILGLSALDPVDADPGGAERGTFIHAALDRFVKAYPDALPPDPEERLLQFGREALSEMRIPQEVEAFWWPRFEKIAAIFAAQERQWRARARPLCTEAPGAWDMGGFTLTAKADRIDRLDGGGYAVIDYKSGYVPGAAEIRRGISPQLPLEALMLEKGAFDGVAAGAVHELVYWRVTGSGQKPVERKSAIPQGMTAARLVEEAEAGLRALVAAFADEKTPYFSHPRADARPRFSDYDHLARVKEWGVSGDGED